MKVFNSRISLVSLALLFYFLIPYLVFLRYFNLDFNLDYQELAWAFKNSFFQSSLTALIVTLLSIPMSLGLFMLKPTQISFVSKLLLIPQILPALFSILIAFSIWQPFPMGSFGIIFIFVLVHLGFATVLLNSATQEKMSSFAVTSEIFGLKRFSFLAKVYLPLMKFDLLTILVMIFIFCFSSFSIPLVAGGGRGTNLEVLIYEKIFIGQNWSAAWTLNIFQSIFIFLLSFFILRHRQFDRAEFNSGRYLKSWLGLAAVFIYLVVYLGGYLVGLINSLNGFSLLASFSEEIIQATMRSLSVLVVYLMACFILLVIWVYDFIRQGKHNVSINLISTSTILVSFSFYLLFPSTSWADYFKITLAMSILFFPALFKSFLEKPLDQLKGQIQVAKIYGLSNYTIIVQIIFAQLKRPLFLWVSFLTVWLLSDFAILKSLGVQKSTLGLMAESFLGSYRLSLAYLLSFYILVLWFIVMAVIYLATYVIEEVVRVVNKKS